MSDPAVLTRLAAGAKGAVLCADLAAAGIDPGALQERGFVTDYAFNGRAALDRLLKRKEKPDLILLDLHMPGMDGYEFLRQIRHVNDEAKVIIVTAHPTDLAELHAADLNIEGYFEKPIIVKDVVDKAEELLR